MEAENNKGETDGFLNIVFDEVHAIIRRCFKISNIKAGTKKRVLHGLVTVASPL